MFVTYTSNEEVIVMIAEHEDEGVDLYFTHGGSDKSDYNREEHMNAAIDIKPRLRVR